MVTAVWAEENKKFKVNILSYINEVAGAWLQVTATHSGEELIRHLEHTPADVAIIDVRMPGAGGFQTAGKIKALYPDIKIIAFTEFVLEANVIEMFKAGVKSFVSKNQPEELIRAIEITSTGGVYLPDRMAGMIQSYLNDLTIVSNKLSPSISDSEALILKYICEGRSSAEIGDFLCRSPRTIEEYREKLYKKFDVKKKEELIVMAVRQNLY